jgi:hypothetical protein
MPLKRISSSDVARLAAPVGLAVITYQLWWHPKALQTIEPIPLLFLVSAFWVTVAVAFAVIPLFKRHAWLAAVSLALTFLPLVIASNPVVPLTWGLAQGKLWWH